MTDDFAAHVNQMERDRQQQQADLAREDMKRRTARWETAQTFVVCLFAFLSVVAICYFVWQGVAGPSANDLLHQEDRRECIAHGGTYTFVNGTEDVVACTMPGVSTR